MFRSSAAVSRPWVAVFSDTIHIRRVPHAVKLLFFLLRSRVLGPGGAVLLFARSVDAHVLVTGSLQLGLNLSVSDKRPRQKCRAKRKTVEKRPLALPAFGAPRVIRFAVAVDSFLEKRVFCSFRKSRRRKLTGKNLVIVGMPELSLLVAQCRVEMVRNNVLHAGQIRVGCVSV